jgi:hypothetical protein
VCQRGDLPFVNIRDILFDVHITTMSFVEEFIYLSSEINFPCFVIHLCVFSSTSHGSELQEHGIINKELTEN